MDRNSLAIADVIRHKTLGLVSHQPGQFGKFQLEGNNIVVRDINWMLSEVSADDCDDDVISAERDDFWKQVHKLNKKA